MAHPSADSRHTWDLLIPGTWDSSDSSSLGMSGRVDGISPGRCTDIHRNETHCTGSSRVQESSNSTSKATLSSINLYLLNRHVANWLQMNREDEKGRK